MTKKKLIILDLDETLIHSTTFPPTNNWQHTVANYKVFVRPGLEIFLSYLEQNFEVAVWSSATENYIDSIIEKVFPANYPLKFIWGRNACTLHAGGIYSVNNHLAYLKILAKIEKSGLGDLDNTIIIDDTPSKSQLNPENAIIPEPFLGNMVDTELRSLQLFLERIIPASDVRNENLAEWRDQIK